MLSPAFGSPLLFCATNRGCGSWKCGSGRWGFDTSGPMSSAYQVISTSTSSHGCKECQELLYTILERIFLFPPPLFAHVQLNVSTMLLPFHLKCTTQCFHANAAYIAYLKCHPMRFTSRFLLFYFSSFCLPFCVPPPNDSEAKI